MTAQRSLLICLLFSIVVFFGQSASNANAQIGPQATPHDFSKLVAAIAGGFPLNGTAYPGNDWCVETQADPRVEWWYFTYGGKTTAHSIYYPLRIRMIARLKDETVADKTYPKFASIFMGIDMEDANSYGQLSGAPKSPLAAGGATGPGSIQFPTTGTKCPDFKDVLGILFEGSVGDWQSVGDPLCDEPNVNNPANPCRGVLQPGGTLLADRQTSDPGEGATPADKDLMYWSFNGRDHKIPRAIRFLIKVSSPDDPTRFVFKYLLIGYGGSGGAG